MEYQKIINLLDKFENKITGASKHSHKNNSEAVTNENDKETPTERYISSEGRQNIIDNLNINIIV